MTKTNHLGNGLWVQMDTANMQLYKQFESKKLDDLLRMFPQTPEEAYVKQYSRRKWTKI